MARKKRTSIKVQIEKTPNVTQREFVWTKKFGKNLQLIKSSGEKNSAHVDLANHPKSDFFIHQHIQPDKKVYNFSILTRVTRQINTAHPSLADIKALHLLMEEKKAKIAVISVIDERGKVMGHNFFKLVKLPAQKVDFGAHKEKKHIKKALKKWNIGLRQRFVPMPGYKFNEKEFVFEKKQVKK